VYALVRSVGYHAAVQLFKIGWGSERTTLNDDTPDPAADPGPGRPEVRPILETYLKERGNIPNMFRTVALRPSHLRTLIAHFRTVMNEGNRAPASERAPVGAYLPLERLSILTQLPHCLGKTERRERRAGRGDPGPGRAG